MNRILVIICIALFSCNNSKNPETSTASIKDLAKDYYQEKLKLFPFEATANGENRYNDQMHNDLSEEFRKKTLTFFQAQKEKLNAVDYEKLSEEDKVTYDILKWEFDMAIASY